MSVQIQYSIPMLCCLMLSSALGSEADKGTEATAGVTPVRDARGRTNAMPVAPTAANVAYGGHERQVLDFYQAKSDQPTPVVFFIHGGGWGANSKENVHKLLDVPRLLEHGISVAAIN
jgi:acetyl esterase/lipase